MPLRFAGNTTDGVNHGTAVGTFTACSWVVWFFPTAFASGLNIFKHFTGTQDVPVIFRNGAEIRFVWRRDSGGTNTTYETNNVNWRVGVWQCLGVTFDQAGAAGAKAKFYRGDLVTPMRLCTTGTQTDANYLSNAGATTYIGDAGGGSALACELDRVFIYPGLILTLDQMRAQQFAAYPIVPGCKLFARPGATGSTTEPDWSGNGNTGTITGAKPSTNNPLFKYPGRTIRRKWFDVPAAAAGSSIVPIVLRQFRTRWAA